MPTKIINFSIVILMLILALLSFEALAHGVDDSTRAFLEQNHVHHRPQHNLTTWCAWRYSD